jgi:hypothetical protein
LGNVVGVGCRVDVCMGDARRKTNTSVHSVGAAPCLCHQV